MMVAFMPCPFVCVVGGEVRAVPGAQAPPPVPADRGCRPGCRAAVSGALSAPSGSSVGRRSRTRNSAPGGGSGRCRQLRGAGQVADAGQRRVAAPGEVVQRRFEGGRPGALLVADDDGRAGQAEADGGFAEKDVRERVGEQLRAGEPGGLAEGRQVVQVGARAAVGGRCRDRRPRAAPSISRSRRRAAPARRRPGRGGKTRRACRTGCRGRGRPRAGRSAAAPPAGGRTGSRRARCPCRPRRPSRSRSRKLFTRGLPPSTSAALTPPNPELVSRRRRPRSGVGFRRAPCPTAAGSGSLKPTVPGTTPSASARRAITVSIAPAAPRVCPSAPLTP